MKTSPDRADVLRMRSAVEQARIADVERLLPTAAADLSDARRTGFADRVVQRRTWAQALPAIDDGWRSLRI